MGKVVLIILLPFVLNSCVSTEKVWSQYKPEEYAYVVSNSIDPEPELLKAGVKYYCNKTLYSSNTNNINKSCYVEKTLAQKSNEFIDAVIQTPKALVTDIVVSGKIELHAFLNMIIVLGDSYLNK